MKMKITQIDLKENCLYVVTNGVLTRIAPPHSGYGKQVVNWRDGRVLDVVKEERQRIE